MNKEDIDDLSPDLKDVLNYMQDPKTSLNLLEKLPIGVWQSCSSEEHGNYVVEELKYENNQYIFPILCKQIPDANLAEFIAVAHTALPYFIDKLAAVEKERDEALAHTVRWMNACGLLRCEFDEIIMQVSNEKARNRARSLVNESTSSMSGKVQKLVDLAELIEQRGEETWERELAKQALAEWEGK